MANIADHNNLELHVGRNLLEAKADILVITQSRSGHINGINLALAERLGIYPEDDTPAGEIDPRAVLNSDVAFKYLIYAVAEGPGGPTYQAVRSIGIKLAEFANEHKDVNTVACGVIGAGSNDLKGIECLRILSKSFLENSYKTLNIYTNDHATFEAAENLDIREFDNNSSSKLAFNASVKETYTNASISPIINSTDFYFEFARNKYDEYINFKNDDPDFFKKLREKFDSQKSSGLIEILNEFSDSQPQYEFLKICGELVAYLDENAAGKIDWNRYPDKRVVAKSHVYQFDWVSCFILYRAENNFLGLPSDVINAMRFFQEPERKLSMLSNRDRRLLLRNIYGITYSKEEDLDIVFKQFKLWGIYPTNPANSGVLISQVLYLDEIEKLWNYDPDKTESDKLFPGNLESLEFEPVPVPPPKTIASNFLTDYYAKEDLLDYKLYASAIVAFINHKNTNPPLTIGIMAPWGKGKTSLMRFIEEKLKAFPPLEPTTIYHTAKGCEKTATFRLFRRWLDKAKEKFGYENTLRYPTVWFNAWKFQKNEQIWAGFAYEIIHQLVNQLPNELAREEFWLRLNLKRVDQEKLRNKIRFKVINKMINGIGTVVLAIISITISILFKWSTYIDLITCGLFPIGAIFYFVNDQKSANDEKIDFDIEKFVKQPDYASKRGYFHEVEDDLRDVMNLLVDSAKPAVIFIDDLDRCSPNTVAEVVEAINLFISGDFPKCYFILGQDAQMVAASLDVAYDKFSGQSPAMYREQGSLGWHFMEKFVQLQFCIPVLNGEQASVFFKNFLQPHKFVATKEENASIHAKASILEKRINSGEKMSELLTPETTKLESDLKRVDPDRAIEIQDKFIDAAAAEYDDNDPEALELVDGIAQWVGTSPRSMKRFINLYRFYRFLQFTNRNVMLQETASAHLGQWIVLMIRWPQLVRAIQWHTESDFISGTTALDRARSFEKLVHQHSGYNAWTKVIDSDAPKLTWLRDEELYSFIKILKKDKNSLEKAVRMGVW
ncbi:KAP family P-loop NTPase fold protein [Mucilaginibacter sp. McL0603]|uniref:KAP family P-loop NTPase fold protein n=1 Tax=Mucilaginibacter sp. McL0603 TaxID=3415670 RepID=UPI003CEF7BDA